MKRLEKPLVSVVHYRQMHTNRSSAVPVRAAGRTQSMKGMKGDELGA